MKTAMQKLTRVIDIRIEKTTNEQSLKILKMVRKDLDIFLEIEERQITNSYQIGYSNCSNNNPDDTDVYYKNTFGDSNEADA